MSHTNHSAFPESGEITLRSVIPPHAPAQPLLAYLCTRFTYHPTTEWERLLSENRVCVNHRCANSETAVKGGDEISYRPEPFEEPPADLDYAIVYEDEWLLGINKPGNLLVHRSGKSLRSNLIYQLRFNTAGRTFPSAGIVNRLDRETSGVVMVAKEGTTLNRMNTLFREGNVRKEYCAVVEGPIPAAGTLIDLPVGPDRNAPATTRHWVDREAGKTAQTELISSEKLAQNFSLVHLAPRTGRTHQIRVHCAYGGFPIVGDFLYGHTGEASLTTGKIIGRQALHCSALAFVHPYTRVESTIRAPLPPDFTRLLAALSIS